MTPFETFFIVRIYVSMNGLTHLIKPFHLCGKHMIKHIVVENKKKILKVTSSCVNPIHQRTVFNILLVCLVIVINTFNPCPMLLNHT